ncbi:IS1595 family transposase [Taibaiella lutea]|uniref:IS1595 family transposase n=1 Tax=Taibaiella lutea TaxID=2608001 RepID=A0A5M6CQH8_9BACT|nr:IS1595 family transposase [Taibaiella lutea]KAA5536232.1 IS1595 family transposase [Taibaiella lutea]
MGKVTKNEYTLDELLRDYPDDDACLEKIFQMTYGRMEVCPKCKCKLDYIRVKGRRAYQCRKYKCYNQVYPTVGTPFEKTRISLKSWFHAIFAFTISKNGISAHEVARMIKVSEKTGLRILKQIRIFLVNDESPMDGFIQIDETFVGGKNKNRHADKKAKKSQGRAYVDKIPVLGMIDMTSGRAIAKVIPDVKGTTLKTVLLDHIKTGSTILTDEYRGYKILERYYNREMCNHRKKQYVSESNASTNAVENLWSCLKRTLNGSYISVKKKYLFLYLKEAIFKYNFRYSSNMFNDLLNSLFS